MEKHTASGFWGRLGTGMTMFLVMSLSLVLLLYVALGEGTKTYERFQGDKLAGQAQIVQNTMQTSLSSGLSLKQFVGFNTVTEPILAADQTISRMVVTDSNGTEIFVAERPNSISLEAALPSNGYMALIHEKMRVATRLFVTASDRAIVLDSGLKLVSVGNSYQIEVPLKNKFEVVGKLTVEMPNTAVTEKVTELFSTLLIYAPIISLAFAVFIMLANTWMQQRRLPWAQITFASVFVLASAAVIYTMVSLYADGAQSKARALAASLGQRLSDVVTFKINLEEIEGLDSTLGEYLQVNPDLSAAALMRNGKILYHTDKSKIGQQWQRNDENYQYLIELSAADDFQQVAVAVELPSEVVTAQVLRSVKNFAALFIASAFLATLFFQVGGAVRGSADVVSRNMSGRREDRYIDYVKPVFFLGVLAEHMTYAFLPQYIEQAAIAANVPEAYVTAPFFGFYLTFALTLIPAGYVAARIGPRPLMYLGLILASAGIFIVTTTTDFWTIALARSLSGVGQGMLFIGIQSYLLSVASPERKTQAAAIIVFGFQGGMISGMAVGSLLVTSMGTQGVFTLSCIVALVAALYCLIVVPSKVNKDTEEASVKNPLAGFGLAISNMQFINTMVTIGIPAKAVLTGIVTFALPLLLAKALYAQADIGQIIMIYAISVVIASKFISQYVDRIGSAREILFYGTMIGAAGLGLIAYSGLSTEFLTQHYGEGMSTIVLIMGIAAVGIAHGFINAPVVTYVAESDLAKRIGPGTATATYRFMERIGHIAGPVVMGVLLVMFDNPWTAVGVVAGATALLGLMFIATAKTTVREPVVNEPEVVTPKEPITHVGMSKEQALTRVGMGTSK